MKFIAAIVLATLLVACGGGDPEDASTQPVDCVAKVEACK